MVDGDGLENRCTKVPWVRIPLSPPIFFLEKLQSNYFEARCTKYSSSFGMEKYPRGRRGSPAKGVGRDERREGSNPSFSAKSSLELVTIRGCFSFILLIIMRFRNFSEHFEFGEIFLTLILTLFALSANISADK